MTIISSLNDFLKIIGNFPFSTVLIPQSMPREDRSGTKYFLLEPIVRSTNCLPKNFSTANSPKKPFYQRFSS